MHLLLHNGCGRGNMRSILTNQEAIEIALALIKVAQRPEGGKAMSLWAKLYARKRAAIDRALLASMEREIAQAEKAGRARLCRRTAARLRSLAPRSD